MDLDKFKMSEVRLTSVPHCTDVHLVCVVGIDGYALGTPIGWCPNSELGLNARTNDRYVGLRIHHSTQGECWDHALTQHLPRIFGR